MPSPSQLKKRLTKTTWHHSMPTAARERIKGSADTKGALARNPYPTYNFQIIYANDVTIDNKRFTYCKAFNSCFKNQMRKCLTRKIDFVLKRFLGYLNAFNINRMPLFFAG